MLCGYTDWHTKSLRTERSYFHYAWPQESLRSSRQQFSIFQQNQILPVACSWFDCPPSNSSSKIVLQTIFWKKCWFLTQNSHSWNPGDFLMFYHHLGTACPSPDGWHFQSSSRMKTWIFPQKKSWVPLYRLNAWKSSDLFWRSFHISNFWSLTLLPTHFWPCNSPLWSRARGKPGGVWLEKLRRFLCIFASKIWISSLKQNFHQDSSSSFRKSKQTKLCPFLVGNPVYGSS